MRNVVVSVMLALLCGTAGAQIKVVAPRVDLLGSDAPQSGSFEVWLESPAGTTEQTKVFQAVVELVPQTGASGTVQFTGYSATTEHTSLLAGGTFGAWGVFPTPGSKVAIQRVLLSGAAETLMDGRGLVKVDYQVSGGASGAWSLRIKEGETGTVIADAATFEAVPFEPVHGAISVLVPEPAGLVALIGAGLMLSRRRITTR